MLTAQLMASMDDEHLVAAIHAEANAMTSTDIEIELLKRFESLLDGPPISDFESVTKDEIKALLEAHEADMADLTVMLAALAEADINTPDELRELIERADNALV